MRVSIVIRAFNEEEHFEKLLLGLKAQRKAPDEIILVDSGSTDSTVEIGRRYGCRVVPIDKHQFTFGRALNLGCAAATGDICVFVSAHVYPLYDDWLETLVAPFEDDRVALTYGRQRGGDVNKFSEHQIFARWFPPHSVFPQKNYFCNNANAAIRKATWEDHPYDEALTGLEDLAWAKSVQAKGYLLAYTAEAEIVHLHDETWDQVQNRYRREAIAMRAIDEHAKFSRLDFGWLLAQHVLSDGMHALKQGVLRREWGSICKFRYNQLLGTWRGFNGPSDVSAELRARFYYPTRPHHHHGHAAVERRPIDYDRLLDENEPSADAQAEPRDGDGDGAAPSLRIVRGDR
ncbi:glycosyltransferase [Methyloceanibacter caenitepidi]|uniref:Glycosyltransferase 2-like domain-containing protein n=1 Tax=Methyloceanibacter caenitepidi TaxID=1384459 RepID=A0A0A8JZ69_9HYPH|nr:glycosyltransferase family 2 protein [Methyloceanibacter caenitepidi]BAQ15716.1 hypothetical protein GL4_0246 [Methyloceanibacter caenitepidi]